MLTLVAMVRVGKRVFPARSVASMRIAAEYSPGGTPVESNVSHA